MDATSRVSCIHADRCPGCALIGLSYAEQLAEKRALVERALARHPELAQVAVEPTLAADPVVEYRVRAKLAVAGASVGAYAAGSHEVVDTPHCRVLSPALSRAADAIRQLLSAGVLTGVTALDLREARTPEGARVLATLVLDRERAPGEPQRRAAAEAVLDACPEIVGVSVSLGAAAGPQLLGGPPETLAGRATVADVTEAATLVAVPGAFVQTHRGQADRIVRELSALLQPLAGARIVDLYGGSGAIGLPLAAGGAEVTLVEAYAPAAAAARAAAAPFGERVAVVAEDVSRFLAEPRSFDAFVVNPPRRGLAPEVRAKLAALGARSGVYVSCQPDTLARDLAHLARLGLCTERVIPVDMIPLTEEVESIALLVPAPPPPPRVLAEDAELVAIDKEPHQPTTPQGEHTGSLLARVRRLPGCENAAPLQRLDIGTSGVCVFGKTPEAIARWSPALSGAKKRYLALCRGVSAARGSINRPLAIEGRSRAARTRYQRVRVVAGHSLLSVRPEGGKKHQIRRHLAGLGHPVIGDARHGHAPTNRHFAERFALDRTFLHCERLELAAPGAGPTRVYESPLPGDLVTVLELAQRRPSTR